MEQSPTPSSYEHDASGQPRRPRSRLSQSISNMGLFQSDSSESTLSSSGKRDSFSRDNLDPASYGVLTGAVGGNFGPFPRSSTFSSRPAAYQHRDSMASSSTGLDPVALPYGSQNGADSPRFTDEDYSTHGLMNNAAGVGYGTPRITPHGSESRHSVSRLEGIAGGGAGAALLWEKEPDDFLHDPDPALDKAMDKTMRKWSFMALLNTLAFCIVVIVLVGLFAGWPIYRYAIDGSWGSYAMHTITNSTGQVPEIQNLPSMVDKDTPTSVYTRTGYDGEEYELVFSDEFNTDGRTFWPGDDPYWEAVDLHYWATTDLEWYDPDAITTKDGNLVITLDQEPWNDLNFRSGMLQSWNKMCFTGGYVEVNLSLPGTPTAQGFWPGIWTFGNLGRAGYGASVDGLWPYTYDSCDVGTLPNQTWPNGTDPVAAKQDGDKDYGGELSYLVGQRLSACTCPADADEHPGPSVTKGRGAPEIDILEGQIAPNGKQGSASQSIQFAPFDPHYLWRNDTTEANPGLKVWDPSITTQNIWKGSISQESASLNTLTDATSYEGAGYSTYSMEYDPGADGRITWGINSNPTWQLNANAMGPNSETQIGQRLVSEEPMYLIFNLAISTKFQQPEWGKIKFPGHLRIDYVRVYQKKGQKNVGCDPPDMPTSKYINSHMDLYTNPNLTTYRDAMKQNNFTLPRNRLAAGGCS
ncbi:Beta-glucan synthesis-associated protein KRE6 [Rhodotorula toruloides]|nr:Beta-glucan synthesis-associated protein KRE6 [Rhodotorula toruloides]